MYNEEVKQRFIKEFNSSLSRRKTTMDVFNLLEPYEENWGSDFCTRSKSEIQPVIGEIVGFRTKSQSTRVSILKSYVRWCIENRVEGACDELLSIKTNEIGLEKLKRQMVASPQHLQRYLNCLFDKDSEETVGCVYRCFYWLAYGGMREEDVLNVTTSDVDLQRMVVRYNGYEYPIYREAVPAFTNCVRLKEFRYKNSNYVFERSSFRERASGDMLLRGFGESESLNAFRVEMSRKARLQKFRADKDMNDKSLDLKLSFYRVWLSGLFYRTYENERAGMPVDFSTASKFFTEGKNYKLDSGRNTILAKQRKVAREYLEDYNRWKEVYSV